MGRHDGVVVAVGHQPDCSEIVYRAHHPEGPALEEYQRLLKQGLVRPTVSAS